MKRIPLTQGQFAIVDAEDYDSLMQWNWLALKTRDGSFVVCRTEKQGGKWVTINMARQITDAAKGLVVDHRNHNKIDNQRANLRVCTYQENSRNQLPSKGTSSKYKGVYWDVYRWVARITVNYKRINLGSYKHEVDAARAYDKAAKELFGTFGHLNFSKEASNASL